MTSSFWFCSPKKYRFNKITSIFLWKPLNDTKLPILTLKKYDKHPYRTNVGSTPPLPQGYHGSYWGKNEKFFSWKKYLMVSFEGPFLSGIMLKKYALWYPCKRHLKWYYKKDTFFICSPAYFY